MKGTVGGQLHILTAVSDSSIKLAANTKVAFAVDVRNCQQCCDAQQEKNPNRLEVAASKKRFTSQVKNIF
jgi:hypothetical protein